MKWTHIIVAQQEHSEILKMRCLTIETDAVTDKTYFQLKEIIYIQSPAVHGSYGLQLYASVTVPPASGDLSQVLSQSDLLAIDKRKMI